MTDYGPETRDVLDWLANNRAAYRQTGTLPLSDTAHALTALQRSARGLLEDALALRRARRFRGALGLAIKAIEELAKVPLLVETFVAHETGHNKDAWPQFWKALEGERRGENLILPSGILAGNHFGFRISARQPLYDFHPTNDVLREHQALKRTAFGVAFREDGIHAPPSHESSYASMDGLLTMAEERSDSFQSWHSTSTRSRHFLSWALDGMEAFNWTTSYAPEEIEGDLLFLISRHGAREPCAYQAFLDEACAYRSIVPEGDFQRALLSVAELYGQREIFDGRQPDSYYARQSGRLELLYQLASSGHLDEAFSKRLMAVLSD